MKAALRDTYLEFVIFAGMTEKYPLWFEKEMEYCVYQDSDRYTFWVPIDERTPDYHDKQLVEDYSVFLRKSNGEVFVTDYDVFIDLYETFKYSTFTNSGLAAFNEDCIEYVECKGGVLTAAYPTWFYEYFTEAINFPTEEETILVNNNDEISVTTHCVFLRNRLGEIKGVKYDEFLKYYDPDPKVGVI